MFVRLVKDIAAGLQRDWDTGRMVKPTGPVVPGDRGPINNDLQHKGFTKVELVGDLGVAGVTCAWSGNIDRGDVPFVRADNLKVDLLIANGKTIRLFRPEGPGKPSTAYGGGISIRLPSYADQTAAYGLDKAGACHQVAVNDLDGDGKPDLLLGNTYAIRHGNAFGAPKALPQLPADEQWVRAAVGDATGDGKNDIAVLLKDGTLVTLTNAGGTPDTWPKSTRKLWQGQSGKVWGVFSTAWSGTGELCVIVVRDGDVVRYSCVAGQTQADDLERLCGVPISRYYGFTTVDTKGSWGRGRVADPTDAPPHPLIDDEVLGCASVDMNGRYCLQDFLLLTRGADGFTGGLPLGYRGYGAFLYNRGTVHTIDEKIRETRADLPPGTLLMMGDQTKGKGTRQHLYFLKPNGQLWQAFNMGG